MTPRAIAMAIVERNERAPELCDRHGDRTMSALTSSEPDDSHRDAHSEWIDRDQQDSVRTAVPRAGEVLVAGHREERGFSLH